MSRWRSLQILRLTAGKAAARFTHSGQAAAGIPQTSQWPSNSAHWSSPKDGVRRDVFSNRIVNAWTLLEACLELGNMERAESVLPVLSEISSEHELTLAVNMYLKKLVERESGYNSLAEDWMRRIRFKLPNFKPNEITDALLLRNACMALPQNPEILESRLRDVTKARLASILKQRELFDADAVDLITRHAELVGDAQVPLDDEEAGRSTALKSSKGQDQGITGENVKPTETVDDLVIREPIRKLGLDTLTPTSSVGLASIRYALQAFKRGAFLTGDELERFKQTIERVDLPHVRDANIDVDDYDFFEIYKSLKTDEERRAFEVILEEVNMKRQMNLETKGIEAARMKWKHTFQQLVKLDQSEDTKVRVGGIDTILWEWHLAMMPLVKKEVALAKILASYSSVSDIPQELVAKLKADGLTSQALEKKLAHAPYMLLTDPENLPAVTMIELIRLHSQEYSLKAAVVMERIGRNVEKEYRLKTAKQSIKEMKESAATVSTQKKKAASSAEPLSPVLNEWPVSIAIKVGSALLGMFLNTARIEVTGKDPVTGSQVKSTAPAFYHSHQYQRGTRVGVIKANRRVANILSGEKHTVHPQLLPMLCKPKPWTDWNDGGYWYSRSNIIRTKHCPEQEAYIAAASQRNQLPKVYDGLNVLGNTAWTINKPMLRVVTEIWNSKEAFLDIPPHVDATADLSHIERPSSDSDPSELRDYKRKCRDAILANGGLYSQRCDLNYKLDIARALVGEKFYLPHNLDFRGRAYPLSPHLNHLGNDVSRSLLLFWEGKKLGPRGLQWLKIHLANLFGVNKISHEERVRFVDDNLSKVIASAEHPMADSEECSWWKHADDPFQALAACFEIRDAMRNPSGPENFTSHLTIHQDGSCNGLQHYAALGGDEEGARGVNLERAERPQDVYSRVLEIVRRKVAADADVNAHSNTPNAAKKPVGKAAAKRQDIAKLVLPILSRKVVKQTVMTHVYGVTYIGAREQIANRLDDESNYPKEKIFVGASYLARHVLASVRELFHSAHEIQDWLAENAAKICKSVVVDPELRPSNPSTRLLNSTSCVSSVIWTNTLGMPIVQPYRKEKTTPIKTELQSVYITDPYSFQAVHSRKQKAAFPPNFVHSLDGSHMLMTAVACKDEITFAAVHDSYWTHASDVDVMNTKLRRCFVDLHSTNLIDKLHDEFQQRYADHLEIAEIYSDSELGRRLAPIFRAYRAKRGARAVKKVDDPKSSRQGHMLTVQELIDLELHKAEFGSAVELVRQYGPQNLQQLEKIPPRRRRPNSGLRSKEIAPQEEDEGVNLDEGIEAEEEAEDVEHLHAGDASPSDVRGKSRNQRKMRVLVPFHVPPVPSRGKFDVRNVLDSPYFFS